MEGSETKEDYKERIIKEVRKCIADRGDLKHALNFLLKDADDELQVTLTHNYGTGSQKFNFYLPQTALCKVVGEQIENIDQSLSFCYGLQLERSAGDE